MQSPPADSGFAPMQHGVPPVAVKAPVFFQMPHLLLFHSGDGVPPAFFRRFPFSELAFQAPTRTSVSVFQGIHALPGCSGFHSPSCFLADLLSHDASISQCHFLKRPEHQFPALNESNPSIVHSSRQQPYLQFFRHQKNKNQTGHSAEDFQRTSPNFSSGSRYINRFPLLQSFLLHALYPHSTLCGSNIFAAPLCFHKIPVQ